MPVYKTNNSPYYQTRFTVTNRSTGQSIRVQETTRKLTLREAKQYEVWRLQQVEEQLLYNVKPQRTWVEAETRWLQEMKHKRTILQDIERFEYLQGFFQNLCLKDITKDRIREVILAKEKDNVKPSTINRYLSLIRAVLNKAYKEWDWLASVPYIKSRPENNERIRWITQSEANRLLQELPDHLCLLAEFSLQTGARRSNALNVRWTDIDLNRRIWTIQADDSKNGYIHTVPLNNKAIEVLRKCYNRHKEFVFVYEGNPIRECNTEAFKKALIRAGIVDFTWHDLRHTWASWHVQQGTSLLELQKLGGWRSIKMVFRYAHLCPNHLMKAAELNLEEI